MGENYPLFLTFTDPHIKSSNTEQIKGLIQQAIEVAKQHGITNLICFFRGLEVHEFYFSVSSILFLN